MPDVSNEVRLLVTLAKERGRLCIDTESWKRGLEVSKDEEKGFESGILAYEDILHGIIQELESTYTGL